MQISETINDISKISFDKKELLGSFYSVLKNSIFLVLKCFKLVFSLISQKNNSSFLMTGFMILFIVSTIIYIVKGQENIKDIINTILLKKKINNKINNNLNKINTIEAKLENRNKKRK